MKSNVASEFNLNCSAVGGVVKHLRISIGGCNKIEEIKSTGFWDSDDKSNDDGTKCRARERILNQ